MIDISFNRRGRDEERRQFRETEIWIGRAPDCHIVLTGAGNVARRNTRVREEDGYLLLEDLGSTNGTLLDGNRVRAARIHVGQSFEIGVGDVTLTIRGYTPIIDPMFETIEAAFLDPLKANPNDNATREVYSDWLEERREHVRARYLRVELELHRAGPEAKTRALPILAAFRTVEAELEAAPKWCRLVSRFVGSK